MNDYHRFTLKKVLDLGLLLKWETEDMDQEGGDYIQKIGYLEINLKVQTVYCMSNATFKRSMFRSWKRVELERMRIPGD